MNRPNPIAPTAPSLRSLHGAKATRLAPWLAGLVVAAGLSCQPALARTRTESPQAKTSATVADDVMEAEVLYLALLAEMQLRADAPGTAFSLMLEAARQAVSAQLYQRAVEIAIQSRSGDAALTAGRQWAAALPGSPEPQRVLVQTLLGLNRVDDSAAHVGKLIELTADKDRNEMIDLMGQVYARANDPQAALRVMSAQLTRWLDQPDTASSAFAALSRVQAAADRPVQARTSMERALTFSPATASPGLLAVEVLESAPAEGDEARLLRFLHVHPNQPVVRLAYARYLIGANRLPDAESQLNAAAESAPPIPPDTWLMLGAVRQQATRWDEARSAFLRYVDQTDSDRSGRYDRGRVQAFLSLSQIAQHQQRFDEAATWLDRIDNADDMLLVHARRAGLLAREGKLDEARQVLRNAPEREPTDRKAKLLAEAQLLRDAKQLPAAYDVLSQAAQQAPDDMDLAYEQAMLAEKLGRHVEMERLLRLIIRTSPDNHHAYNALGYSLADRNERLTEARELITKALGMAPNDPFIMDSMAWVEYRQGNLAKAAELLRKAFGLRNDPDIAAHLGEVLWKLNDQEGALRAISDGLAASPDNETLRDTIQRLGIQP